MSKKRTTLPLLSSKSLDWDTHDEHHTDYETLRFFRPYGEYGWLSNFYPSQIWYRSPYTPTLELSYPTVEHWYQCYKFRHNPQHFERIRNAPTPLYAKRLGNLKTVEGYDLTWEKVRLKVMRKGVLLKFTQHIDLAKQLIATGTLHLIENSPYDAVWGCGAKGDGLNLLGMVLEEVRSQLNDE